MRTVIGMENSRPPTRSQDGRVNVSKRDGGGVKSESVVILNRSDNSQTYNTLASSFSFRFQNC